MSFSYQESIRNLEWGHGEGGGLLSHMHFGYNSRTGISIEQLAGFLTTLLHPLGMNWSLLTLWGSLGRLNMSHAIATYEVYVMY